MKNSGSNESPLGPKRMENAWETKQPPKLKERNCCGRQKKLFLVFFLVLSRFAKQLVYAGMHNCPSWVNLTNLNFIELPDQISSESTFYLIPYKCFYPNFLQKVYILN
jgi:hypothetical protein